MAKDTNIILRCEREFKAQIEVLASKENRTVSNYIENLLKIQIKDGGSKMKKTWLELIEENEEEIVEVAVVAFKEALENTHLKFIVEMDSNGVVSSWYDTAGGNMYHVSSDREIEVLMTFCNQCFDIMSECEGFDTKEEAIDWYVSEYAREEAERKIEFAKERLDQIDRMQY